MREVVSHEHTPIRECLLFSVVLIAGLLDSVVSSHATYLITTAILLGAGLYFASRDRITIPWVVGGSLLIIVAIWSGHLLAGSITGSVSQFGILRLPIFIALTAVTLFIIPQSLSVTAFSHTVSRFATALVFIGLLPYIFGNLSILGVGVKTYPGAFIVPVVGWSVAPMQSVFPNPNTLAVIALLGTLTSLMHFDQYGRQADLAAGIVCLLGLYLGNSRTVLLTFAVAAAVYTVYKWQGQVTARLTVIGSGCAIALFLAVVFSPLLPDSMLNGREVLWPAVIKTISDTPLFGIGLIEAGGAVAEHVDGELSGAGIHSAFFYVLLTAGSVGAASYTILHTWPILAAIKKGFNPLTAQKIVLAIAMATTQLFQTYSIFGASLLAVLSALSLGYVIESVIPRPSASG